MSSRAPVAMDATGVPQGIEYREAGRATASAMAIARFSLALSDDANTRNAGSTAINGQLGQLVWRVYLFASGHGVDSTGLYQSIEHGTMPPSPFGGPSGPLALRQVVLVSRRWWQGSSGGLPALFLGAMQPGYAVS
jgi:hypothetical protein